MALYARLSLMQRVEGGGGWGVPPLKGALGVIFPGRNNPSNSTIQRVGGGKPGPKGPDEGQPLSRA